nr:urea transporter 2-like [Procambarus clarkii]
MFGIIQNPPVVSAWLMGDAPAAKKTLAKYSWTSPVVAVKVLDSILRGISQVVFVNNPVSGFLILVGLLLSDVTYGLGALVCALTAVAFAKLVGTPNSAIEAGLSNYDAVLVGVVTPVLYPLYFHQPLSLPVWGYMVVASIFSVCASGGLGKLLAVHHLPAFTLPFNLVITLTFMSLKSAGYEAEAPSVNATLEHLAQPNWEQVWLGTLLSAGQVFGVEDVLCSTLVMMAMFIFSPILTVASYTGATVATFTAVMVSSAPYAQMEAGVWGYNGFLSAAAVAFFMVPTPRTLLLAVVNSVFTVFLHAALSAAFTLPVFSLPFCVSSLVFLSMAMSVGPASLRVSSPSFPELHLILNSKESRINKRNAEEIKMTITTIS